MLKPLNKNILIEPELENRVLATQPIETDFGTVIEVGDECTKIKKGDRLAFLKFGVKRIETDSKKYVFIAEDSPWLLGIVTND
jgi:co-chaperonin GroES (HSP10)